MPHIATATTLARLRPAGSSCAQPQMARPASNGDVLAQSSGGVPHPAGSGASKDKCLHRTDLPAPGECNLDADLLERRAGPKSVPPDEASHRRDRLHRISIPGEPLRTPSVPVHLQRPKPVFVPPRARALPAAESPCAADPQSPAPCEADLPRTSPRPEHSRRAPAHRSSPQHTIRYVRDLQVRAMHIAGSAQPLPPRAVNARTPGNKMRGPKDSARRQWPLGAGHHVRSRNLSRGPAHGRSSRTQEEPVSPSRHPADVTPR